MADIIAFPGAGFDPDPDLESMDFFQLSNLLEQVRLQLDLLNDNEPEDMDSDEFEDWAERHEQLEDLEEDIQDFMAQQGG